MDDSGVPPKPYSKGRFNAFRQQKIRSIFVVHSPFPVAFLFFLTAILCIPIGIVEIVYSSRTTNLDFRYDNINNYSFKMVETDALPHTFSFSGSTYSMGERTFLLVELKETIVAPSVLKYRLKSFHQNFRSFFVSKDAYQLFGKSSALTKDCQPFRFPGEVSDDIQDGYYSPCGSIPWSMFNDSFKLYKLEKGTFTGSEVPPGATLICDGSAFDNIGNSLNTLNQCSKDGIALPSLLYGYKEPSLSSVYSGPIWKSGGDSTSSNPYNKEGYYYNEPGHLIPDPLDKDFILWSSPAFLPDFTTAYRVLNVDLESGEYLFEITELFSFPGEKHIVLSTDNWIGSFSPDVGGVALAVGCFSLVAAIAVAFVRYPFT